MNGTNMTTPTPVQPEGENVPSHCIEKAAAEYFGARSLMCDTLSARCVFEAAFQAGWAASPTPPASEGQNPVAFQIKRGPGAPWHEADKTEYDLVAVSRPEDARALFDHAVVRTAGEIESAEVKQERDAAVAASFAESAESEGQGPATEGWQTVPVTPSIAMCIRGAEVADNIIDGRVAAKVYAAMLHATRHAHAAPQAAKPAASAERVAYTDSCGHLYWANGPKALVSLYDGPIDVQCARAVLFTQASPEARAEAYIQSQVDQAPEPLRRLAAWLSEVLDENQWPKAERMILGAVCSTPPMEGDALDAKRFRYLTEDIADRGARWHRNDLLRRMAMMSYSAACTDIDIAIAAMGGPKE